MNCLICNNNTWDMALEFRLPDRYEAYMGFTDVQRSWLKCCSCGLYRAERNYSLADFQKIYDEGYRDPTFRGKTIQEAYAKIIALPPEKSENFERFKWFIRNISKKTGCNVLDIGSGLGVWPDVLNTGGYNVWCVETNKDSIDFIHNELKIKSVRELPTYAKFDIITCLHILEHMEKPKEFINSLKPMLKNDGQFFIEVPDAVEFEYLEQGNNEFSSDHVWFFNLSTLSRLLDQCGLEIIHAYRPYYKERRLSRLLTIAQLKRQ